MSEKPELQYHAPAAIVRRLRDYVAHELAGLNEDNPIEALLYAEYRLANELQMIRLVLGVSGKEPPLFKVGPFEVVYVPEEENDDTDET
jgi:hypothetical protein